MSATLFPHAALLADELENEVQRLDALQRRYAHKLMTELTDPAFLNLALADEAYDGSSRSEIAAGWSSQRPLALPAPLSTRDSWSLLGSPATACLSGPVVRFSRASQTEQHVKMPAHPRDHRPLLARTSTGELPLKHRECISPSLTQNRRRTPSAPQRGVPASVRTGSQPPPPLLSSRRDEEARRARRALRCLREARDAYVNAKARRAQQLLAEGREATQASRARHAAAAAAERPVAKLK